MRINNIRLRNYRCFEDIGLELHDKFNLIVGINGTGKTAILEALRIAIGSLFLSVDKYKDKISSPTISQDDVRLQNLEQQFPVFINTVGDIDEFDVTTSLFRTLSWERSLETKGGNTKHINAKEMKEASSEMQRRIRNVETETTIPLIAYYSTERFKKEKRDVGVEPDGSRLRGYYHALDPLTNIKFFLDLWNTETLSDLQNGTQSPMLAAVAEAVKSCINNCEDVKFDIKQQELIMTMSDTHERLPFHVLSDGVRSMFAMVMEIAFRCYLLNPHLREDAARETSGVVLIDEIDLHLHPEWQKRVIGDLRRTFPKIQFIVSTHAPLVIGSLTEGRIFSIKEGQVFDFPLQYGRDANFILNEMGTEEMDKDLKDSLKKYFLMIECGQGKSDEALTLRRDLEYKLGENHTELQRANMMLSFF
ncbi:AAA family ATPase [Bacteroides sp.]|uniref:AAA family ATPase n=1 Tax=Bacteroides sp. TaxID=29523 RepID=UPI00260D39F8|nr:AAA family ATPase [Bacteroides sp.]MDD3038127.1 AAA family ATPase [Bacteroides sp.]